MYGKGIELYEAEPSDADPEGEESIHESHALVKKPKGCKQNDGEAGSTRHGARLKGSQNEPDNAELESPNDNAHRSTGKDRVVKNLKRRKQRPNIQRWFAVIDREKQVFAVGKNELSPANIDCFIRKDGQSQQRPESRQKIHPSDG